MNARSPLVAVLLALGLAAPAVARSGEEPFPTRTVTLKEDDLVLRVDGRVEVPRNAKVVSLRKAQILGSSGGVLEVSGTLQLKCVTGGKVVLKDVWIELTPECKELYLSGCVFEGNGGIRTGEAGPTEARVYVEGSTFEPGTSLAIDTAKGKLTFSGVKARGPFRVRGVAKDEKGANRSELQLLNLRAYEGLHVEGVRQAFVTMSLLDGPEAAFADCAKLDLVSNLVRAEVVKLSQATAGSFGKTTIKATDFHTGKVVFAAPAKKPGDAERVAFESCWFLDANDPDEVRRRIVLDVARDPAIAVQATFKKLREEPLELVRYTPPE